MAKHTRPRIALFIQGGTYAYQEDIIWGAHEESQRREVDLICLAGGHLHAPDPRCYAYDVGAPSELDAAILVVGTWGVTVDSPAVQEIVARYSTIPCCVIGARVGDLPSVRVDNAGAVEAMTRHLIEVHERRRIAFLEGRGDESDERRTGYERALRAAGIPLDPALILPGEYSLEGGRAAAEQLCAGKSPSCDAIVAANDWMASGALEVLRQREVRVPDDVALVGFDDIERSSFMSPPLTTIRQPPHYLGTEAVAMLSELLAGREVERHVLVPTFARIRRSCGCFGHGLGPTAAVSSRGRGITSLATARGRIAQHVAEVAGALGYGLPDDWAARLIDALAEDLEAGGGSRFVEHLLDLVKQTSQRGNITAWHHVVGQLREHSVPILAGDLHGLMTAESLFGRAYIAIGEQAELAQGLRLLQREDLIRRLEEVSRLARTALEWRTMCRLLAEQLPGFGVASCFVAVGSGGADAESRQIFALQGGKELAVPERGKPFVTREIVAPAYRPAERSTLMVQSLYTRDEILGFCAMDIGPKDTGVYKTLVELISSALEAARLNEALIREVTRRERAERERIQQEFTIAARIQTALLPRRPSVPGLELATAMLPATEVGGDYFDILPCPGGSWIGIGDVAGHGLTAGMIMLMIQSIVAATVHGRPELGPARAWCALNAVLSSNIRERMRHDDHATLTLIRYHDSGQLTLAGSHEDLIVFRAESGECERVPTPGIWAGIFPDVPEAEIVEVQSELSPGDVLLLYTDGIVEARDASGVEYGIDRLERLFRENATRPVGSICEVIVADVMSWMDKQEDDVSLVVARHVGRGTAAPSYAFARPLKCGAHRGEPARGITPRVSDLRLAAGRPQTI